MSIGKSSLVQMIEVSLKNIDKEKKYIFINFNAWLYQGYDDARMALLQKVADRVLEEVGKRQKVRNKVKNLGNF